jgi:hypothetical protein
MDYQEIIFDLRQRLEKVTSTTAALENLKRLTKTWPVRN